MQHRITAGRVARPPACVPACRQKTVGAPSAAAAERDDDHGTGRPRTGAAMNCLLLYRNLQSIRPHSLHLIGPSRHHQQQQQQYPASHCDGLDVGDGFLWTVVSEPVFPMMVAVGIRCYCCGFRIRDAFYHATRMSISQRMTFGVVFTVVVLRMKLL